MKCFLAVVFMLSQLLVGNISFAGKTEKHQGKVISAMGTYEGEINIRLNEANKEMIEITTFQSNNPGGGKRTESIKINSALVQSIVIDTNTYFLKSIEYADGKYYSYCCVKLVEGSENLGIYQWGTKLKPEEMVIHHKMLSAYTLISSPTLPKNASTWFGLFKDCKELREEMKASRKGFITAEMDTPARLQEVRRLITASADCLK